MSLFSKRFKSGQYVYGTKLFKQYCIATVEDETIGCCIPYTIAFYAVEYSPHHGMGETTHYFQRTQDKKGFIYKYSLCQGRQVSLPDYHQEIAICLD